MAVLAASTKVAAAAGTLAAAAAGTATAAAAAAAPTSPGSISNGGPAGTRKIMAMQASCLWGTSIIQAWQSSHSGLVRRTGSKARAKLTATLRINGSRKYVHPMRHRREHRVR